MIRALLFFGVIVFGVCAITTVAYLYFSQKSKQKERERTRRHELDRELFSDDSIETDPIEAELERDDDESS